MPARVIPPPPNMLMRCLLLLIDPEAWARAAMYGFRTTFGPLLLIALLMGGITAAQGCREMYGLMIRFGKSYDSHYAPMVLSHGQLHLIATKGKVPLKFVTPLFKMTFSPRATPPQISSKEVLALKLVPNGYFLAGHGFFNGTKLQPYKSWQQIFARTLGLPLQKGKTPDVPINSTTILLIIHGFFFYFLIFAGIVLAVAAAVGILLWAAVAMVFAAPAVAMVNIQLRMPLRVAYRIACAVMVPMVVLRSVLMMLNILPAQAATFGGEMAEFIVPVAVAVWAGVLAKRMYAPPPSSGSAR